MEKFTLEEERAKLAGKVFHQQVRDAVAGAITTNFHSSAPAGIEYGKNFAASVKQGRFAVQVK